LFYGKSKTLYYNSFPADHNWRSTTKDCGNGSLPNNEGPGWLNELGSWIT